MEIIEQREVLGKQFRIYGDFENPLFLAKDVAEWIEHSDVSMMLSKTDDDEKLIQTILVSGQNRKYWFLTEDGLYEVLMQSRKPIAKQFKKQVKAILKEIRKTGSYSIQQELFIPTTKKYLGEDVATVKDVAYTLKRSEHNIRYLLTKCKRNEDYIVLNGDQLAHFKEQNPSDFLFSSWLLVIFKSGFRKICDMLGESFTKYDLFPVNRSFARPKDNPEIQGWIDDIKGHMDVLDLLLFKYGNGNPEKIQEGLKEVLISIGADIWRSIFELVKEDYKLVKQ